MANIPSADQTWQTVHQASLPIFDLPGRSTTEDVFDAIANDFEIPLRLYASETPDAVLNIKPNVVQLSNGVSKLLPLAYSALSSFPASTINFQTEATSGGTINTGFPSTTIGNFRRCLITYDYALNELNLNFSAEQATVGALAGPSTLKVSGQVSVGYIDLEATASTAFKTAGSATSIIENSVSSTSRIFQFPIIREDTATIYQLQDYTTIGSVGSVGQQDKGHEEELVEPGMASGDQEAFYQFGAGGGAITDDEKAAYNLTNVGSIAAAGGLFGGASGAVEFNGTDQYFSQATLLDTVPTAIGIMCWFNSDSGTTQQAIFQKINDETVGSNDYFSVFITATGRLQLSWAQNDAGNIRNFQSEPLFGGSSTGWHHLAVTWDTTNGPRLHYDTRLVIDQGSYTTLMANSSASARDFLIGASFISGTPANFFNGKMAYFRVVNKVLTQKNIDLAYSVKYDWASSITLQDAMIIPYVKEDGSDDFVSQLNFGGMEVTRTTDTIYRYGGLFNAADKLKLVGRE
jgi:hypothetical protein